MTQGESWVAALAGHNVDPLKQQEEQQRLMLERFQEEVIMYEKQHQPVQSHTYMHVSVLLPGVNAFTTLRHSAQ